LSQTLQAPYLLQGSKTTVEGDARVFPVDYSNKQSVKDALAGVDVVICTISTSAIGVQVGIAEAAKEAGIKLFVPSEFGGTAEGTPSFFNTKASVRDQLRAMSLPYALFYTGPYADWIWTPCVSANLYLAIQLTIVQIPGACYHERESVGRWRWQHADFLHI
jgi:uncharacterized protein YbjT (DUF2867 family)